MLTPNNSEIIAECILSLIFSYPELADNIWLPLNQYQITLGIPTMALKLTANFTKGHFTFSLDICNYIHIFKRLT